MNKKRKKKKKTNKKFKSQIDARSSLLKKNMFALRWVNPVLFERISYPVDDSHTRFTGNGMLLYRVHRLWYSLEPDSGVTAEQIAKLPESGTVLLFGLGSGAQLIELLQCRPDLPVIAWERDPWLLRVTLQRADFSSRIRSGQLQFSLGPDLVDEAKRFNSMLLICHPFLGTIYRRELDFFQNYPHDRVVLLREGTLFVDDLMQALQRHRFGVYSLDTDRLSKEELHYTVKKLGAEALASINYQNYSAEFCRSAGIRLLCWEIDPSVGHILRPTTGTGHVFAFSYRKSNVAEFKSSGFRHVEYLPLAANTSTRKPAELTNEERQIYGSPVSFVGASMVQDALQSQHKFFHYYREWCGNQPELLEAGRQKFNLILEEQRHNYSIYRIPELMEEHFHPFLADYAKKMPELNFEMMIAETSASEKRFNYLAKLTSFGVKVWGDEGWHRLTAYGVTYSGRYAKHRGELNKVYSAGAINIDIGRIYQPDIVTMRVFDVLACGGFLIAEYSEALAELFEIGVEIVAYRSVKELYDKVKYYTENPDKAKVIAGEGRLAVLKRHSLTDRFNYIFTRSGLVKTVSGDDVFTHKLQKIDDVICVEI